MQIIISMAGLGSRFSERGFITPKHLIKIDDKPLIELAIETLDIEGKYIFIVRKTDYDKNENLKTLLRKLKYNCEIIEIDYVTDGPATSCYLTKHLLNSEDELIISNCDQILEWNSKQFLEKTRDNNYDCSVLTYFSDNPKNSFIKCDENNKAIEIKEKEVISNNALVGVHYFKKAKYFVHSYEEIFAKNTRTNNEFYVSNVCNNLIKTKSVGHVLLDDNEKYHSTGTPDCYFKYLRYINKMNIKMYKLEDMFRGWFVGDFEPSVFKHAGVEIGYLLHKKGEKWQTHYHNNLVEVNLLIQGRMILNDIEINKNEIFVIDKKVIACPIFLEDCYIMCIKIPSMVGDKIVI
jgi:dTDP-glucose pyrophosphorylase